VKKEELLHLYQQGERNFRNQNLSGQSFCEHNLSDADFSGANIRGADFSRSVLRGANFTGAQAGLQPIEAALLGFLLVVLIVLLGVAAGSVGTLLNLELRSYTSSFEEITAGWVMLLVLLAFALISVLEGVKTGFAVFVLAFILAVGIAAIGPIFVAFINPLVFAVASGIALAITIVSAVSAVTMLATTSIIAAWCALNSKIAVGLAALYVVSFGYVVATTNIATSIIPVVPAVMLLSGYLGWRALQGDPRHGLLRRVADGITYRWGTSFRDADLTQANFSQASLKNSHFDGAILTRVCWTGMSTGQVPALSSRTIL
jgi:uncharacterized protein YjbI with pentapeptide repeats